MGKSSTTKEIEKLLIKRAISKSHRYALECPIKGGFIDFISQHFEDDFDLPIFYGYEIKVSESDFNSENGHNLHCDYNWYVVTKELWCKIKAGKTNKSNKYHKYFYPCNDNIGFIMYNGTQLREVKKPKITRQYYKINLQERYKIMNSMLKKWCTGSMQKYLDIYKIRLKNN